MLKNYLKITLRNLIKNKAYSLINLLGLTIGMTCAILILLWIQDELSFDRFHEHSDRIYRMVKYSDYSGNIKHAALTPGPLARAMKQELPEVEYATAFDFAGGMVKFEDKTLNYVEVASVEPDFFNIFSFPLIHGNPESVLSEKDSIILTRRLAEKIFGQKNPVGKILTFNKRYDYKVTGIMENIPRHSHLQFDCIIPFKRLKEFGRSINHWKPNAFYTYIMLGKEVSERRFNKKIKNFKRDHYSNCRDFLYVQPLTKIHLYSDLGYDIEGHGDIKYVIIFLMVAGFILLIACFNFINLSTAISGRRAKEVGMRKVLGSNRTAVITQFLSESLLLSFLAMTAAVQMIYLVLPHFNQLCGKELRLDTQGFLVSTGIILSVILFTGVFAGSYPAFYLSKFEPVKVLKGDVIANGRYPASRRILVVLQFSLSIFMIICVTMVSGQLKYIQKKKLGFEKHHVLYTTIPYEYEMKYDSLKYELLKSEDITHVTRMNRFPTSDQINSYTDLNWEGKNPEDKVLFCIHDVGYDMFETFGIELEEGREFSKLYPTDRDAWVLNEKAVDIMGIQEPVGKIFSQGERSGKIIGVVKNFHFKSLKNEVEPLVFRLPVNHARQVFIRISSDDIRKTLRYLESKWKMFIPEYRAEFGFLDDAYDGLYRSERRMEKLVGYFAFLAIFISCMGLFGLTAYSIERRIKEIGIRKVLGASIPNVIQLLMKEFMVLVLISNLIAWPVAYFIMSNWLKNYVYHTGIQVWIFILAGIIAFLFAFLTVGYRTLKAARANPVVALRYE